MEHNNDSFKNDLHNRLYNFEAEPPAMAWEVIEEHNRKSRKRRGLYWLPVLFIAIIATGTVGYFSYKEISGNKLSQENKIDVQNSTEYLLSYENKEQNSPFTNNEYKNKGGDIHINNGGFDHSLHSQGFIIEKNSIQRSSNGENKKIIFAKTEDNRNAIPNSKPNNSPLVISENNTPSKSQNNITRKNNKKANSNFEDRNIESNDVTKISAADQYATSEQNTTGTEKELLKNTLSNNDLRKPTSEKTRAIQELQTNFVDVQKHAVVSNEEMMDQGISDKNRSELRSNFLDNENESSSIAGKNTKKQSKDAELSETLEEDTELSEPENITETEDKQKDDRYIKNRKSLIITGSPELIHSNISDVSMMNLSNENKMSLGMSGALQLDVPIRNHASIRTGIGFHRLSNQYKVATSRNVYIQDTVSQQNIYPTVTYNEQGQAVYSYDTTYTRTLRDTTLQEYYMEDVTSRMNLLTIPFSVNYRINGNKRVAYNLGLGINTHIFISNRTLRRENASFYTAQEHSIFNNRGPNSIFSFSFQASAGFQYKISDKLHVLVSPKYTQFVSPLQKKSELFQLKPFAFGIDFGISYRY